MSFLEFDEKRPLEEMWRPAGDFVLVLIENSIKNDHRRSQGSQRRIWYQFLIKNSIKNDHWRSRGGQRGFCIRFN